MATPHVLTWLDRVVGTFAPHWALRRARARLTLDVVQRHYEGAATGRRTQGWRRSSGDANLVIGPALARLREDARDLVRNNPYAESALTTIADHAVGWGIVAKPKKKSADIEKAWAAWANTTDCDADGKNDFAGLQKLVIRTVAESGEVLVRRRLRRPEDGFAIPMQIQVMDPDFLDTAKDTSTLPASGVRIIQGVEFDPIGRRIGYWLFPEHPGSSSGMAAASERVDARNVRHIFKQTRPGQVRAPSWFAQVLLRFKDFDEFEDATLVKQKIAACLAVFVTDSDGSSAPLGEVDPANPTIDSLSPGMITNMPIGSSATVVEPPQTRDYDGYSKTVLRAIATGLGVTYEDMTGDYQNLPFSAARMSRLRHEARVHDWRWRILIPQFCDPAWRWAMEAAAAAGIVREIVGAAWTPPPLPVVDPSTEGLGIQRLIRSGLMTQSEAIRQQGYDPDELYAEMAADNAKLDALGIVLDSDPRQTSQAGLTQGRPGGTKPPKPGEFDEGDEDAAPVRAWRARR